VGAETLVPVAVESNTLSNHNIEVATMVQEIAVAMAVAKRFNYFQETMNIKRGEQKKLYGSTDYYRFVNSTKHKVGRT
jgi:hypothetical protein